MLMEADNPVFKLRLMFDICSIALEERRVPQIDADPNVLKHKSMYHISA